MSDVKPPPRTAQSTEGHAKNPETITNRALDTRVRVLRETPLLPALTTGDVTRVTEDKYELLTKTGHARPLTEAEREQYPTRK